MSPELDRPPPPYLQIVAHYRELIRSGQLQDDEQMERAQHDERTDQRAITIAEHREWPDRPDWEEGPDALRYPGLYDTDEPDPDDEDDVELLDLDEDPTAAETTGRRHPAP
jgi:hypothetical protein